MAKSVTLTAMLLVLWLAMSVGTWAEDSESWTEWLSKYVYIFIFSFHWNNLGYIYTTLYIELDSFFI